MRLLHVVDTLNPVKGGVSQAVRTMASEIALKGIYNAVLTLDAHDHEVPGTNFEINNIGPSSGPWSYSRALSRWLIENLARFDAVIVHGLWLYHGFAVKKALSKFKYIGSDQILQKQPRLFIMPHGMLDPYFQRAKTRRLKAIRNWVYWKLVEGPIINNSDGILFTCKQECMLAREPFRPYLPRRELIVGLGVSEPPRFKYAMIHALRSIVPNITFGKYILFMGRIDDKKGIDLILSAYKRMIEEQLESRQTMASEGCVVKRFGSPINSISIPKLLVAGPGMHASYGLRMQDFVEAQPMLKGYIHFTGMLSGEAKWAAMYGCEAFILPSHQENFGIAVVEALACGKPVLISRQVNINAEIAREEAAIIADDTADGVYDMLTTWISAPEPARIKMRDRARKCYEKHFAVNAATNNLINAIL